jgi:hypothetical protein
VLTAALPLAAAGRHPLTVLLLLAPVPLYAMGAIGLVRSVRLARDGPCRRVVALLVCDAVLMVCAGVFYYSDLSFDLQLFALPCIVMALAWGLVAGFPRHRWLPAAAAASVASGLGLVRAVDATPAYGFHLATQLALVRRLEALHPRAVLTVDPITAYALAWIDPGLPVVYFEGAHSRLRYGERESVVPALRALLDQRSFDTVALPERPLFDMRRDAPWDEIRELFRARYGSSTLVGSADGEGVTVYSSPRPSAGPSSAP